MDICFHIYDFVNGIGAEKIDCSENSVSISKETNRWSGQPHLFEALDIAAGSDHENGFSGNRQCLWTNIVWNLQNVRLNDIGRMATKHLRAPVKDPHRCVCIGLCFVSAVTCHQNPLTGSGVRRCSSGCKWVLKEGSIHAY